MPSVPTVREPDPEDHDGEPPLRWIALGAGLCLLAWALLALALCRLA